MIYSILRCKKFEFDPETLKKSYNGFKIPEYMHTGLHLWIEEGLQPGSFLKAVLCNDLENAVGRADEENLKNLPAYIYFLYNFAPSHCWGSEENFETWKGLKGEKS